MIMAWMVTTLQSVARPNMAWERAKLVSLNDARVRRAIVRLGWAEQWEAWLQHHEVNAARAFGVKVTNRMMRSVSSGMASVFTIVLYILLRQELQSLL